MCTNNIVFWFNQLHTFSFCFLTFYFKKCIRNECNLHPGKNWGIRITLIFIKVLKILNKSHISMQICVSS